MISALLAAMVAALVVVAGLLAVVLVLLCRLMALWAERADPARRPRGSRAAGAGRPFSGGSGAVERSVHSTTRVVRR